MPKGQHQIFSRIIKSRYNSPHITEKSSIHFRKLMSLVLNHQLKPAGEQAAMKKERIKTSTSLRRHYPVQVNGYFSAFPFRKSTPGFSCQEPGAKYDKGGIVGLMVKLFDGLMVGEGAIWNLIF